MRFFWGSKPPEARLSSMWGTSKQTILGLSLAAFVISTGAALADAKWIKVDPNAGRSGATPQASAPAPQAPSIWQMLFGTAPVPEDTIVTIRRGGVVEPAWTYQPQRRSTFLYGVPVNLGSGRGYYVGDSYWTPYRGTAVTTGNGYAVSRPERSVSGSLRNAKVGRKITRKFR